MPIHDVGYRKWSGPRSPASTRWWMIAETGIRLSLKSAWVRRIIFFCWLPILYWGVGLFAFEQVTQTNRGSVLDFEQTDQMAPPSEIEMEVPEGESNPSIPRPSIPGPGQPDLPEPMQEIQDAVEAEGRDMIRKESLRELRQVVSAFPGSDKLMDIIESGNKEQIRHTFWTWLLMTYFRYPQSVALIFLVGFITPSLIARDIRSRALMIYFSRPIGRFEYIFGKLAIPSAFLAFITTLPALALYLLGIFLSPDPSIIFWTWDIPLRILLASGVVIIPTVSLALMLSSLTQESRFAAFAWFAIWALGQGAWFAVLISSAIRKQIDPIEASRLPDVQRFSAVSLYNNLGNAQSWIFGFEDLWIALPSLIVLLLITVLSLFIVFRRVSKSVHI